MKTFYLCGLLLLLSACGQPKRPVKSLHVAPSDQIQNKVSKTANKGHITSFDDLQPYAHSQDVICNTPVSVDTLINQFHVRYKWLPNEDIIQQSTWIDNGGDVRESLCKYADNSLYIDAYYDERKIVSVRKICKEDLKDIILSPVEIDKFQIHEPYIEAVTDSTFILNFGLFMPDTDVGSMIELLIANDGRISFSNIDEDIFHL